MKKAEYEKLIDGIYETIGEKGIPVDIRHGNNGKIATYIVGLIKSFTEIDTPVGIVKMADYNACRNCGSAVGDKARYCKKCGAWLREGGE